MKKTAAIKLVFAVLVIALLPLLFAGCKGDTGDPGAAGEKGASGASAETTGTVSGTVTSATGAVSLAGVAVTTSPNAGSTTTAADGTYSLNLPGGYYTITFAKTYYTSATANVNVANGVTTPSNATMALASTGKPSVTATASGQNVGYGQSFTVTANATSPIGSNMSYVWTNATGTGATGTATSQALTGAASYYDSTCTKVIGGALNGTTAPTATKCGSSYDPGGYVSAYTPEDRLGVMPIMADTRGAKPVTVKVTDTQGGSTSVSVTVNSATPNPGVRQVPIGTAVYLNSGTNNAVTWAITTSPSTTAISTITGTTRFAYFTPDVEGKYVVSVTTPTVYTMDLYAGKFVGAISGGGYTSKTFSKTDPKAGMWFDPADADKMGYFESGAASSHTYTNWPTVTFKSDCASACHKPAGLALDQFTPWAETSHATFFSRGLEGITGNRSTCLTCHTTGYDGVDSINDGGFDYRAKSAGYVYKKSIGAWALMTTNTLTVAEVANIQCENCHGPQGTVTTGHMTSGTGLVGNGTSTMAVRVSYSSDVCGVCHASGTGHHIWSEWKESGHSNLELAIEEGLASTSSAAAVNGTSCTRCHSAQGFVIYLSQMSTGTPGNIVNSKINWDETTVEPQTCSACHDPHSDANPYQLRVYDSTPVLPTGFSAVGMGKGAICITCHNSRTGMQCVSAVTATGYCSQTSFTATYLHEDNETYNGGAPSSYSTAHASDQGDVFMGRNAYFMGSNLPMISRHANVEDACVGCHMALNPETHLSHGAANASTHRFTIDPDDAATVCANCHSANVTPEGLYPNIYALQTTLATKMAAYVKSEIGLASGATGSVFYKVTPNSACTTTLTFSNAGGTITSSSTGTTWGMSFITGTASAAATKLAVGDIITTSSTTNPGPFTITAATDNQITVAEVLVDELPVQNADGSWVTRTIQKFVAIGTITTVTYRQGLDASGASLSSAGQFDIKDDVKAGSSASTTHRLALSAIYKLTAGLMPLTSANAGTVMMFPLSDKVTKAVWNSRLIDRDGSKGVHNPSFIYGVLTNTIGQF